jgi:hypothetical protein
VAACKDETEEEGSVEDVVASSSDMSSEQGSSSGSLERDSLRSGTQSLGSLQESTCVSSQLSLQEGYWVKNEVNGVIHQAVSETVMVKHSPSIPVRSYGMFCYCS